MAIMNNIEKKIDEILERIGKLEEKKERTETITVPFFELKIQCPKCGYINKYSNQSYGTTTIKMVYDVFQCHNPYALIEQPDGRSIQGQCDQTFRLIRN